MVKPKEEGASHGGGRTLVLSSVGRSREIEQRLRDVFRRALREALAPTLALGLFACADRPRFVLPPMASADADVDASALDTAVDKGASADAPRMFDPPGPDAAAGDPGPEATPDAGSDVVLTPPFEGLPCANGEWIPVVGLTPAQPVDYIGAFKSGILQSETGDPCASASDRVACLEALEKIKMGFGSPPCSFGWCLAVTGGGVAESIDNMQTLLKFLGPIDTPQEAALVVSFAGYFVICGDPGADGVRAVPGGFEVRARAPDPCGTAVVLLVARDGTVTRLTPSSCRGTGRRPEGLRPVEGGAARSWTLPTFLAECAHLEAASVPAFLKLAADLARLEAPPDLVAAAARSAEEEVRHARIMAGLAARYGAAPPPIEIDDVGAPDLFALACENAIEGCVYETFGAAVAAYQARAASDPEIARTMADLAEDETRHAALSWQIAGWAEDQLESAARAELAHRRALAVDQLRAEVSAPHADEVYDRAGWPPPAVALKLIDEIDRSLWQVGTRQF